MGKRGPQPKPTALRVFEGQRLERPAGRQDEPCPDVSTLPIAPDWLGEWGRAAWDRMAPVLHATKLLTDADVNLFEQWCYAHDVFHQARLELAAGGICIDTQKGRQANPAAKVMSVQTGIIIKIGQLFGMGPSSRVGLSAPTQDSGHDDLDNFKRTAVSG